MPGRAWRWRRAALGVGVGVGASVAVSVALTATSAGAQQAAPEGLRTDDRVDLPVAIGAAGLWFALEILKETLAPATCRVCDRHVDGTDGLDGPDAAARAALRWDDPHAAGVVSDATGFVLAPLASLGMLEVATVADHRSHEAFANALVVVEATAIAVSVDDLVKLLVARQRPFVHFRDPAAVGSHDADENLSFYSGHTTLAFSLAVASGTIASMRGYPLAPAVWAGSLTVAAVTGYLRIAADKHYLTDVVAGALAGAAIGFVVPFVFHRAPTAPEASPVASGDATTAISAPAHAPIFTVTGAF